jgi:hypothetical protein
MAASDHFRAHGRRRVDLPATLRDRAAGWQKTGRVVNLALSGACLELPDPVELDARITVEIVAPTLWDPLVLEGRVAWVRYGGSVGGARAGVEFEPGVGGAMFALFELLGAHAYDA